MKLITIQIQPSSYNEDKLIKLVSDFVKDIDIKGGYEETEIEVSPNDRPKIFVQLKC